MQVAEIDKYNCLLDFEGNEGDPFDGIYGEDGITPIPLTKEIILSESDRFSQKHKDEPIPFWKDRNNFYCGHLGAFEVEVRYVHEVQNFLRAIGFTEEADNFKIK